MLLYFPSCKFTGLRPEISLKVQSYMKSRGAKIAGCCRQGFGLPEAGDIAVTVCESCNLIISENRPGLELMSLAEFIDADENFVFPDLGGEMITVQDCLRAKNRPKERAAVRSLLRKMNFEVVELEGYDGPEDAEARNFDGAWLYAPMNADNLALAPKSFSKYNNMVTLLPPEEAELKLGAYCKRFETEKVCCYCNTCLAGLEKGLGGGRAFHITELVFK
ncbi:MAG: hypothetical protein IJM17_03705 [Firmicutes bacterium]|nr:hypothetical protein [Bacillota bacterium]